MLVFHRLWRNRSSQRLRVQGFGCCRGPGVWAAGTWCFFGHLLGPLEWKGRRGQVQYRIVFFFFFFKYIPREFKGSTSLKVGKSVGYLAESMVFSPAGCLFGALGGELRISKLSSFATQQLANILKYTCHKQALDNLKDLFILHFGALLVLFSMLNCTEYIFAAAICLD